MSGTDHRTLHGIGGVALLVATVVFLASDGFGIAGSPSILVVVGAFLAAGLVASLAAVETRLSRAVGWRRLVGVALSLTCLGLVVGAGNLLALDGVDPVFVAVVLCSIVAAGVVALDLLVFDGAHVDPSARGRVGRPN